MWQIDLTWFSKAFQPIIDLYEHAFLIISVLGQSNLKVIFPMKPYLVSYLNNVQKIWTEIHYQQQIFSCLVVFCSLLFLGDILEETEYKLP